MSKKKVKLQFFARGDRLTFVANYTATWKRDKQEYPERLHIRGGLAAVLNTAHDLGVKLTPFVPKHDPIFVVQYGSVMHQFGRKEDAEAWMARYEGGTLTEVR